MKEREQFGQKISKFQGLRWIIADMATEIEAARQLMLSAAAMKDRGENYTAQASMAKLFASQMAVEVTRLAMQVHGSYGVMKTLPVERLYRDAKMTEIYVGISEVHRTIIANRLI